MSFDDMARVNGIFHHSGAHLGFHLRARIVYKSLFYTQTLDTTLETPISLSLSQFHVFLSVPRVFMC